MTNLGERLKKLIHQQGFNNKTFAQEIGVAPNYISILFKKEVLPNSFIFNITKVIPNLNVNWLENGEGEMFTDEFAVVAQKVEKQDSLEKEIPLIKEHIRYIEDAILFSKEQLITESEIVKDWVETIKIQTRIEIIKKLKEQGRLM